MEKYRPRIADRMLEAQLSASGIVLIQGPKWCGKTTTAEQHARSILYMDYPKTRASNLLLAETDPQILFQGDTPRLIDEWQLAPKLWDAARFEVSHRGMPGQLIFTTHQTCLLNQDFMRTDEVWLVEKKNGGSHMYSLNDFKIHNFRY